MLRGANWFYWIAALSVLQILAMMQHMAWGTAIGLAAVRYPDQILSGTPYLVDALAVVVFIALGIATRKPLTWVFVFGMLLYVLDGALFLIQRNYAGVAIHLLILYFLWGGLSAAAMMRENQNLERDLAIRAALQKDRDARAKMGLPPPGQ
jgi:hypothetical protein